MENATKIRQFCLTNKNLYTKQLIALIKENFNIDLKPQTLYCILKNKSWYDPTWIPLKSKRLSGEDCKWSKLNWEIVNYIRKLYLTISNYDELNSIIKTKFNVNISKKHLTRICKYKSWVIQERQ